MVQERTHPITDQCPLHVLLVNYLSTSLLATSWDTLATMASSMRSSTFSGWVDPVKASCLSSHTTCSMICLHDGKQTDLIVMDFAKAFDKVCYEKLLTTLHSYSVDPTTIHWIRGFLSNRTATTCHFLTSGVPQGTLLGPALFLCYNNSMPEGISSSLHLFADDIVVYRHITSAADHAILQPDIHKLARWEAEYSMEFHPQKCNVLRVTRSRSPSIFNYTLHGTTLKSTESTKFIGVTLTKDLTWGNT